MIAERQSKRSSTWGDFRAPFSRAQIRWPWKVWPLKVQSRTWPSLDPEISTEECTSEKAEKSAKRMCMIERGDIPFHAVSFACAGAWRRMEPILAAGYEMIQIATRISEWRRFCHDPSDTCQDVRAWRQVTERRWPASRSSRIGSLPQPKTKR